MKIKNRPIIPLVASAYALVHRRHGFIGVKEALELTLKKKPELLSLLDNRDYLEEILTRIRGKIADELGNPRPFKKKPTLTKSINRESGQ